MQGRQLGVLKRQVAGEPGVGRPGRLEVDAFEGATQALGQQGGPFVEHWACLRIKESTQHRRRQQAGGQGALTSGRCIGGEVRRQQNVTDAGQCARIARQPAHRVEARGERQHPLRRHRAVCRSKAEQPAMAGRHPHRSPRVGAEREVAALSGHRGRGSRGRPAGHPFGAAPVERRPVVRVLAREAERQLIGQGQAYQRSTFVDQRGHGRRRAWGRSVRRQPGRVAEAGRRPFHREQVLGSKAEPGEPSIHRAVDPNAIVQTEGTGTIGRDGCHERTDLGRVGGAAHQCPPRWNGRVSAAGGRLRRMTPETATSART